MRAAFYERRPPSIEKPAVAPINGFTYKGCFADGVTYRALPHAFSGDDMTPAKCAELCPHSKVVGLEYGRECWCGPSLAYEIKVYEGQCGMTCVGNADARCGDRDLLSVYERDDNGPAEPRISGYEPLGW
jgi:hypothetical protein